MPGARANESHVFIRIRECRNQQLVQVRQADAAGLVLKLYSAKDTLTFLEKHFVQDTGDQHIIICKSDGFSFVVGLCKDGLLQVRDLSRDALIDTMLFNGV